MYPHRKRHEQWGSSLRGVGAQTITKKGSCDVVPLLFFLVCLGFEFMMVVVVVVSSEGENNVLKFILDSSSSNQVVYNSQSGSSWYDASLAMPKLYL